MNENILKILESLDKNVQDIATMMREMRKKWDIIQIDIFIKW